MDTEQKAYFIAILSIIAAPLFTILGSIYRARKLNLTKDNIAEVADRTAFRTLLLNRVSVLEEQNDELRSENGELRERLGRLEAQLSLYQAREGDV